ncbi:hypothetical protein M0R45_015602 [Rubus argutus]|uniref:Uncharacterized protein n=1 Tax=Rubus argutus TaxID=59490 RepID=A0AAW1XQA1_RUBAR
MLEKLKRVEPYVTYGYPSLKNEGVSFLWPFALNKPEVGLKGVKALYKQGGDTGNREDKINELMSKMN